MKPDQIDDDLHTAWRSAMLDLCKSYRFASEGEDVRDTWRDLMAHLDNQPASMTELTDAELRTGIELQLKEIDRLKMHLRVEDERDCLLEINGKQANTIVALRAALKTIEPYVRDKKVSGRKPLKDGIFTLHIGQIVRDALDGA